ncbi:Gfo/Idh/MocA family oxidoreductase [Chryseolinea sp. T2]|uniref:Gfo/Idh/MocA family protein n=1 Tax=Chryseolinea sp. T2 TaxID=3129255 RepID=UPI0030779F92
MQKIRWGILGCGKIANKFAADLKLVDNAELVAVGARDIERARSFASTYGASLAFDSYVGLVTCPGVDVIYVATPHGYHHEHTLLCLRHGKAVLCEKALALNLRQVKEMIEESKRSNVFLMEAFWTKFLPQYQKMQSIVSEGTIGQIRFVQADFGFNGGDVPAQRLYDPALGGGSLLDIGIYPVFLAVSLLGRPVNVNAIMDAYDTGVDKQIAINLQFESGALATLSSSFEVETPVTATIMGTRGYIKMKNRFHNATCELELVMGRDNHQDIEVSRESGYGYQFEARHVSDCMRDGLKESPVMSFNDSLLLMETLDRIRERCGIRYAVD